jgi:fructokinase
MVDVVCLGEALVDLISQNVGSSIVETPAFDVHPGGAPANVAVGLARLGASSAFIGKLGQDGFGDLLVHGLSSNGVETEGIVRTDLARTGLAFVTLNLDGEREFLFYRHPSADMLLEQDDVDRSAGLIQGASVFHFGSLSLSHEPARSATLHALEVARAAGCVISFDPNLRLDQWRTPSAARERIRRVLDGVDLLKLSEAELDFLSGGQTRGDYIDSLWRLGIRLVVATRGADGCLYFTSGSRDAVSGFQVQVVDTTGAGDGFAAGFLYRLVKHPELFEQLDTLVASLRYANAVAAITTACRGAVSCLPSTGQVETFLEDQGRTKAAGEEA